MIKRIFWTLLSIAFPWLVLLLHDNPGGAVVALILQATVFGWIPATVWAMRAVHEAQTPKKKITKKKTKRR